MKLWFDASDAATITESGGAVSQWNDKSGNNNHATQAVGSQQPTIRTAAQNGLNTLRFTSASQQFMSLTNPFTTTAFTSVSVKRRAGPAGGNIVILFGGTNVIDCMWFTDAVVYIYGNVQYYKTSSAISNVDYRQVSVSKSLNTADAYVGGSQVALTGPTPFGTNDTFQTLGRGNGIYCNGEIAEMFLFDRILSTAQRQGLEEYLKNKWGTP